MSNRILYFKWYDGGSEHYRLKPLEYIDRPELTLVQTSDPNQNFQLWYNFDTFILLRPQGESAINLMKVAKRWHKRIIIDWDDLPTAIDQFNPMYSLYEHEKRTTIECLVLADEIWVSTEAIKQAFRLYNKNIHVIPNAHDEHLFPVRDKRPFNFNKKVLYRGGESHYGDIYDVGVAESIVEMVNSHPDWEFQFWGQRFHWLEKRTGKNYIACPGGWPMIEFQRMIQKENAAIFFYPLADTVFNRSKSNCSWLESTYCGSSFFGMHNMPEFKNPGIADLSHLPVELNNPDEKVLKLANEASWNHILDNLLVSHTNKIREERLLA